MTIQLRYFARLREEVGRDGDQLDGDAGMTAADAWASANPSLPMPANTLVAINQNYAQIDSPLQDGDEVAFFPPVTGG